MKKALVTGSNGFVGKWLTDYLINQHIDVCGIDLQQSSLHRPIVYRQADIVDAGTITNFIADIKPDFIFNLAGASFPPDADRSPKIALDAHISGTMNLLDALRAYAPAACLLLVGSAKEYSPASNNNSIDENEIANPASFYGISKFISELIGIQYHRQFGIDVRCTRSFNHTGPGQSPLFVCSDWARQLAAIKLGLAEPEISVGNLDVVIDFSDVRDVVAAYYQIITRGKPGETYNVCSGKGTDLQWILDYLIDKSNKTVAIRQKQEKLRSNESKIKLVGSYAKLNDATGWKPSLSIEQTLDDLYDWWLQQLTKT